MAAGLVPQPALRRRVTADNVLNLGRKPTGVKRPFIVTCHDPIHIENAQSRQRFRLWFRAMKTSNRILIGIYFGVTLGVIVMAGVQRIRQMIKERPITYSSPSGWDDWTLTLLGLAAVSVLFVGWLLFLPKAGAHRTSVWGRRRSPGSVRHGSGNQQKKEACAQGERDSPVGRGKSVARGPVIPSPRSKDSRVQDEEPA